MKTILVPTDFSSSSRNATVYAANFAREMKAKLFLFHSFQVSMPSEDMPVLTPISVELEKKSEKILKKVADSIEKNYQIKTETHVHAGFYPSEEILRLTKKLNPDLVVMGGKEKSKIAEVFAGSTVQKVMRNIKMPLIIVPEKAEFIKPEKILFAFEDSISSEADVFLPLRKISKIFYSEIYVVNVVESDLPVNEAEDYFKLDQALNGINRVYCFPRNENSQNSIDAVLTEHKVKMIAMVPRTQGLIERILGKNDMQILAFHAHLPFLVLPANNKPNQRRIKRNSYEKVS